MICLIFTEKKFKEFFLTIYIFCLLFAPPFFKNINFLLVLAFFSLVILIIKYRDKFNLIIKNYYLKNIILILLVYYIWQIISIIINCLIGDIHLYNYMINFYSMFLVFPLTFICALFITFYIVENKFDFNCLIKLIIYAGLIQSVITLLSFVFPSVKNFLLNIMYENTGEQLYLNKYHTTRRFFGFANNLLDSFGFGTGILAILPLFYSIRNGKKWLIAIPFLLIVPFLNSRTGLLVFAIGFIIWLIYLIKNKLLNNYFKIFIWLIISIVFLSLVVFVFAPTTVLWIVNDILSFFNVGNGTANILFSENFWSLPKLGNIIIGCGILVAGFGGLENYLGFTSDVGYINEIWKTGIVGLIIMFVLLFYIVKFMIKNIDKHYKYLIIFLFVSVLIANIKFYVYGYNPGVVIILLLFVHLAIYNFKFNSKVKDNDLISVIVPVYNTQQYLEKCLDSIVKQTYQNLEIILVNDGSIDESEIICQKYQKKDKRIKYIKQHNGGLSVARNTGIENANGKYLIFIDSDDYVNVHFVDELYSALINNNSDIAVCDYQKVYEKDADIYSKNTAVIQKNVSNKFDNLYNENSAVTVVAWNKIYKKEIFDKIKYPIGKIHEDEYIIHYILDNIKSITYVRAKYYYYYQRESSITGSYSIKRLDILEALKDRAVFFENKGMKNLNARAFYDYFYQLCYQKEMMIKYFPNEKVIIDKLNYSIKLNRKQFFNNIYINPLRKLKILIKFYLLRGII